jgi:hypothetical protein
MACARISFKLYLLPPFHTRRPNNVDAIEARLAGDEEVELKRIWYFVGRRRGVLASRVDPWAGVVVAGVACVGRIPVWADDGVQT